MDLLSWKIVEVVSTKSLQKIMFRGKVRKFALEHKINLLIENDEEDEKCVRFAVLHNNYVGERLVKNFIRSLDKNTVFTEIGVFENPVLSKLKVNDEDRYTM